MPLGDGNVEGFAGTAPDAPLAPTQCVRLPGRGGRTARVAFGGLGLAWSMRNLKTL